MSKNRLDRREAIAKRWGDEAYAVEELRAEICSAILAAETGALMSQAHIDNHAAYLKIRPQFMLGLERQLVAMDAHEDWVADYDRHM